MNKKVLVSILVPTDEHTAKLQKFPSGTRVRVENLPPNMQHFWKGEGVVLYSYAQMYGGAGDTPRLANTYSVYFDDGHQSAWYPEYVLVEIK